MATEAAKSGQTPGHAAQLAQLDLPGEPREADEVGKRHRQLLPAGHVAGLQLGPAEHPAPDAVAQLRGEARHQHGLETGVSSWARASKRAATASSLSPGLRNASAKAAVIVAASRAIPSPSTRVISAIASWLKPASRNRRAARAALMSSSEKTRSPGWGVGSPSSRRIRIIVSAGSPVSACTSSAV